MELTAWGGYVDLAGITSAPAEVKALGVELGRATGAHGLGWAIHKFTAQMGARHAHPGCLRLVEPDRERAFLAPLAVDLLPLPAEDVQRLGWLGIRTLGQFAALPAAGVWERFGKPGKLAQRWARGQDDRPVRAGPQPLPPPVTVEMDPPTELWPLALAELMAALSPLRQSLAEGFLGICRLGLTLAFGEGESLAVELRRVEPVSGGEDLAMWIDHGVGGLAWPGELAAITATVLDVGDLSAPQLALFPLDEKPPVTLAELAAPLAGRYETIFHRAQIHDPSHPVAGDRWRLAPLVPDPQSPILALP